MTNYVSNEGLRNVAIIAHVDHGKTTLVDAMFRQSGMLRAGETGEDRMMDRLELERERGITISAKNCSVYRAGMRINILDTPGHADFGGEVERALVMADGAVLLVDAAEGPLPQTRFVLRKALQAKLAIIVCLNKIDRSDARPQEVLNEIYDLFIDLDATEEQLDFPVLYTVGREGIASRTLDQPGHNLDPLFDVIIDTVPAPKYLPSEPFQMIVANLDYSDYLGRLAIGKVVHGSIRHNDMLVRIDADGEVQPLRVGRLQVYYGLGLSEVEAAQPGDIIIMSGVDEVEIGDTICHHERPKSLPRLIVDQPTVGMRFGPNTSPLAGREGQFLRSQKIKERLERECLQNVAIQVERTDREEVLLVKGRGEFQLAILIETMRREGFELTVGRPEILFKEEQGQRLEPIEHLLVDCGEQYLGIVTEKLSARKGRMTNLVNHGSGRVRVEFSIPARSLIGYRNEFLTDTKGTGIMYSYLEGWEPYRGAFILRSTGSLVSDRSGNAVPYALFNLEPRGRLFVTAGTEVYEGMVVGEHNRDSDLNVNPCKTKKLTNIRAAAKDEAVQLTPIAPLTLEAALDFIRDDELVEVTPHSIRIRKAALSAAKRPIRSFRRME